MCWQLPAEQVVKRARKNASLKIDSSGNSGSYGSSPVFVIASIFGRALLIDAALAASPALA